MTKKDALLVALSTLTAETYRNPNWTEGSPATIRKDIPAEEIRETLTKMVEQLSKSRPVDEEKKAAVSAARKEKTAQARAELVAKVVPVLREVLSHTLLGLTAKDIYGEAASRLPANMTAAKVQNILLREMRTELNITEAKGKANTYTLKSVTD